MGLFDKLCAKEKKVSLCGKCAAIMRTEVRKLIRIEAIPDEKVTCELCGCRRYGGTYEIQR